MPGPSFPEGGALVTGGTGNIGQGIVRRLAEAGMPVTFTYAHDRARAEQMEIVLQDQGLHARACPMDMESISSIGQAIDFAQEHGGRLHTVACASGPEVPVDLIADMDIDSAERFMNADAIGQLRLVKMAVPALRSGGGGSLTLCTSIAIDRALAFDGMSSLSKAAVRALVKQLAWEEARHRIRCNAVCLSLIVTGGPAGLAAGIETMPSPRRERIRALAEQIQGLMRLGLEISAEAVGDLYTFLASDQAQFITGQSISIDAGATL